MKITLFTSNKNRHNYLINLLSEVAEELYVIQECGTIFPGLVPGHYEASLIMEKYPCFYFWIHAVIPQKK